MTNNVNKTHFSYDERGLGGAHMIQQQFLTMYRKIQGATKVVDDGPPHSSLFRRPHHSRFGEYWEKVTPRYRNADNIRPKVDSRPPESMPFLDSLFIVQSPKQRGSGSKMGKRGGIDQHRRPSTASSSPRGSYIPASANHHSTATLEVRPPWDGDPSTKTRTFGTSAKQMMMESMVATDSSSLPLMRPSDRGNNNKNNNGKSPSAISGTPRKVFTPLELFEFACERRREELAVEYDRIQQRKRLRLIHLEKQIESYGNKTGRQSNNTTSKEEDAANDDEEKYDDNANYNFVTVGSVGHGNGSWSSCLPDEMLRSGVGQSASPNINDNTDDEAVSAAHTPHPPLPQKQDNVGISGEPFAGPVHTPYASLPVSTSGGEKPPQPNSSSSRPISAGFQRPLSVLSQQSKYHPASSRPSSATNRGGDGSGAASVDSSSQLRPTFITPTEGDGPATTPTAAACAGSPLSPIIPASASPLTPHRRGSARSPNTDSVSVTLMKGLDCDISLTTINAAPRRISVTSTLMRSASSQSLQGSTDSGGRAFNDRGPHPPSASRATGVAVATDFIRRIRSRGSLKAQASANYDD